jgi:orotidine-5'-phosphate decarboxylase
LDKRVFVLSDYRLCLALDVSNTDAASDWVRQTASVFGVYKIGLELFCAEGPKVVDAIRKAGAKRIFLDLKLHDIPRTVAGAVNRIAQLGIEYLTIHTAGGPAMMSAAAEAASERMSLLGVTVLTSFDAAALRAVGVSQPLNECVLDRGRMATANQIPGLVCSALEVAALRIRLGADPILVTPGIRFANQAAGDQKRVVDPASALASGSTMLVMGRAITDADNLNKALTRLTSAVL